MDQDLGNLLDFVPHPVSHGMRDPVPLTYGEVSTNDHVQIDESLRRPAEVDQLIGDRSKAERILGWAPETSFEELIRLMVDADYELLAGRGGS